MALFLRDIQWNESDVHWLGISKFFYVNKSKTNKKKSIKIHQRTQYDKTFECNN